MNQFQQLLLASKQGIPVSTITLAAAPEKETCHVGKMLVVFPDGSVNGCLVDQEITGQIVAMEKKKQFKLPFLCELFVEERGNYTFFFDELTNHFEAVVFGGGHISQPLVEILALLDFKVTVIDDRPQFANAQRFPKADKIYCADFTAVAADGKVRINRHTAVIIITRGHQHDLDCLKAMLNTDAGYLGMIGSRRRIHGVFDLLRLEGVPESSLAQVKAPIGLDIGAQTPAEIAVSIASEIIAAFRGGDGRSLSRR